MRKRLDALVPPMRLTLVLVALVAFLPFHASAGCAPGKSPVVAVVPVPHDASVPPAFDFFYVVDPVPCGGGATLYQETNGIPGLQRGDECVNDVADCTDGTPADTDVL